MTRPFHIDLGLLCTGATLALSIATGLWYLAPHAVQRCAGMEVRDVMMAGHIQTAE
jgi:hypothetical protein